MRNRRFIPDSRRVLWYAVAIVLMLPYILRCIHSISDNRSLPESAHFSMSENVLSANTSVQTADWVRKEEVDTGDAPIDHSHSDIPMLPLTGDTTFFIEIPKISLAHTILSNVDPSNKNEYLAVMDKGIAHGKYTALPPDPDGNVYLFAHSRATTEEDTPQGGWFTRIDELEMGDVITLFYHGQTYTYTVATSFIVDPDEVSVYSGTSLYPGHRSLTLQTCYPRGETTQRLIVKAIGE